MHIECFTDIHLFGTCRLKKSNCGWSKELDFIRYVLTFKFSNMMDQHSVFCLAFLANFAHPVFTNLVRVLSNPIVYILLNQFLCEQSGVEKCDDCFFYFASNRLSSIYVIHCNAVITSFSSVPFPSSAN